MESPLDIDARCFSVFGCPKCGAKHKYGHDRERQFCYMCTYDFIPSEGRLYENDRIHDHVPQHYIDKEIKLAEYYRKLHAPTPWYTKVKEFFKPS